MPKGLRSSKILPNIGFNNRSYAFDNESHPEPLIPINKFNEKIEIIKEKVDDWKSVLTQVKTANKWLHLVTHRRRQSNKTAKNRTQTTKQTTLLNEQYHETLNTTLSGIASELDDSSSDEDESYNKTRSPKKKKYVKRNLSKSSNKALIIYFSKLARSKNDDDELDLEFIESLLDNGADINMWDKYGQTIFHEVARAWHTDVGVFLLAHNANINQADKFGRTPLHIAAAVNYPDMVKFLIESGANINAKTYGEHQTPVHYAAKNDAVDSLITLCKLNCDIEVRDSKARTPLQVAAELDRSETALFLVEQSAQVGITDSSGLSALTLMIEKMPPVAKKALNQFHKTDRPNRKQYFYLNLLEPVQPGQGTAVAKTPLQAAIINKQMNLLLHPVFRQLLFVKWNRFAFLQHCLQSSLQFFFVIIWSVVGVTTPFDATSEYSNSTIKDKWWRCALEVIAVLMTLYFIVIELYEYQCSSKQHKQWQEWRSSEMQKDLNYCHPRWPEEQKYINQELERIKETKVQYFKDLWNILDWITFIWILAGVLARIGGLSGNTQASDAHKKILATSMIVVWLRLMKVIRAFQPLGPFIVMLGNILEDTLKFGFLFLEFFIPYIIAFWILFGGSERAAVMTKAGQSSDGWQLVNDLIYSVWLVTLIGDFDYNALRVVDKVTAQLLIGTYTAVSGILLMNLFIALMSDTFQRVYDNAKANALMQKAIAINTYQVDMNGRSKDKFRIFLQSQCAPQQIYYDDDDNDEDGQLEKMTIQIKEVVDEIKEDLDERIFSKKNNSSNNNGDGGGNIVNKEFCEGVQNSLTKQETEMDALHDKINELTGLVKFLIDKDKNEKNEIDGEVKVKFDRLPSIFDLKPGLFSETKDK